MNKIPDHFSRPFRYGISISGDIIEIRKRPHDPIYKPILRLSPAGDGSLLKNFLTWWQKIYHFICEPQPSKNIGRLAGIRDIITFHGETVDELEAAFKEAVDDYLATCAKLGDKPNKPYSGKLTLRVPPNVHAVIATAAETSGKSLNKWVADMLDQATHAH